MKDDGRILTFGAVAVVAAAGLVKQRGSGTFRYDKHFTIQKGDNLYHATRAEEDFEIPSGPAMFSDSRHSAEDSAIWCEGRGPGRVLVYKTKADVSLVFIENQEDEEQFEKWLEEEYGLSFDGTSIPMSEKFCSVENGWHIDNDHWAGSETTFCEPDRWLEFVGVEYLGKRPRGWRK